MDTTILTELFQGTNIFGQDWIFPLILSMFFILIITRDKSKWGTLMFPVSVMMSIAGLKVGLIQLFGSALVYVQNTLSFRAIGNVVAGIGDVVKAGSTTISRMTPGARQERRLKRMTKGLKSQDKFVRAVKKSGKGMGKAKPGEFVPISRITNTTNKADFMSMMARKGYQPQHLNTDYDEWLEERRKNRRE